MYALFFFSSFLCSSRSSSFTFFPLPVFLLFPLSSCFPPLSLIFLSFSSFPYLPLFLPFLFLLCLFYHFVFCLILFLFLFLFSHLNKSLSAFHLFHYSRQSITNHDIFLFFIFSFFSHFIYLFFAFFSVYFVRSFVRSYLAFFFL